MKTTFSLLLILCSLHVFAQFDGAAGAPGSLAIDKDSTIILAWANNCVVQRGWMDASDTTLGVVTYGTDADGAGIADGTNVVSLGDSGSAVLAFNPAITNGPGPDFAVFENSFSDNFLELAFVEVSSNGVDFFRFPATSNIPTDSQIGAFDATSDPTLLHNLAGKYRGGYGTPFDLSELDTVAALNINQITHVRIVDVVGSISTMYGMQDRNDNYINDPFPTPFPSSGFDLDGIAVLHQGALNFNGNKANDFSLYPNPVKMGSDIHIHSSAAVTSIQIFDLSGKNILTKYSQSAIKAPFEPGIYVMRVTIGSSIYLKKIVVQ